MSTVEVSFILPAYNESAIITRNLDELHAWLSEHMPTLPYEVLLIDDGSSDGMGPLVDDYAQAQPNTRVVHHERNRGRGRAIRTGFEHATGEFVICLDADLSYAPDHIPKLLAPLREDGADITLASPYHPEGSVSNVPFSRALLSRLGNRVLSRGVRGQFRTVTCVVRGFRRSVLDRFELVNDGKDLHLEIIQQAMLFGLHVVEVPAHLRWRDKKRSKPNGQGMLKRVPFLSMSSTIVSHLLYNFLLRPSLVLLGPGLLLVGVVAFGGASLLVVFLDNWLGASGLGLYQALRETLVGGSLTLSLVFFSLVLLMVFGVFYFLSFQSQKQFESLYVLCARQNARIKRLEERLK